jgi:transaldolase
MLPKHLKALNALQAVTCLVADTADMAQLQTLKPQDVTTNPSLVLKALSKSENQFLLRDVDAHAVTKNQQNGFSATADVAEMVDRLLVHVGCLLLQHIPGRVSAEVDPRLSFDTQATAQRARQLASMFQAK